MSKQLLKALQRRNPAITHLLAVRAVEGKVVRQQFSHGRSKPVKAEKVVWLKVAKANPGAEAFKKFRAYRPSFSTTAGIVPAGLHKVGFSKVNREPVAYYLLRYYDSNERAFISSLYLYGIRRGEPTMLQQLSRRVVRS